MVLVNGPSCHCSTFLSSGHSIGYGRLKTLQRKLSGDINTFSTDTRKCTSSRRSSLNSACMSFSASACLFFKQWKLFRLLISACQSAKFSYNVQNKNLTIQFTCLGAWYHSFPWYHNFCYSGYNKTNSKLGGLTVHLNSWVSTPSVDTTQFTDLF